MLSWSPHLVTYQNYESPIIYDHDHHATATTRHGQPHHRHLYQIADAEQSVADSVSRIEALTALVETMESNMVSPDTTLEQLYEVYPDLEAEIEAEIEAHEWGKDI